LASDLFHRPHSNHSPYLRRFPLVSSSSLFSATLTIHHWFFCAHQYFCINFLFGSISWTKLASFQLIHILCFLYHIVVSYYLNVPARQCLYAYHDFEGNNRTYLYCCYSFFAALLFQQDKHTHVAADTPRNNSKLEEASQITGLDLATINHWNA